MVLGYASDAWTLSPTLVSSIQAVEMDNWGRCIKVKRIDKVQNNEVKRRMEVFERAPERIG